MIAIVTDQERVTRTREKLETLKQMGFRYIVTQDDGDSWVGSDEVGLEIDELIDSPFMGEIRLDVEVRTGA